MIWKGLFKEHKDGEDTDIAGKEEVEDREGNRSERVRQGIELSPRWQ